MTVLYEDEVGQLAVTGDGRVAITVGNDLQTMTLRDWWEMARAVGARPPYHVIRFDEDGWMLQHPISCGTDLFVCAANQWARRRVVDVPAGGPGRYRLQWDACGFRVGERLQ